jgi:hypothetical protein
LSNLFSSEVISDRLFRGAVCFAEGPRDVEELEGEGGLIGPGTPDFHFFCPGFELGGDKNLALIVNVSVIDFSQYSCINKRDPSNIALLSAFCSGLSSRLVFVFVAIEVSKLDDAYAEKI